MGALMVVELQEAIKRGLQRAAAGEILPPKRDAPVLVQDGFLQSLREPVGPRVAGPPCLLGATSHPQADANDRAQQGETEREELEDEHGHLPVYPSGRVIAIGRRAGGAAVNRVSNVAVSAIIER